MRRLRQIKRKGVGGKTAIQWDRIEFVAEYYTTIRNLLQFRGIGAVRKGISIALAIHSLDCAYRDGWNALRLENTRTAVKAVYATSLSGTG